jgi:hypothetical protein
MYDYISRENGAWLSIGSCAFSFAYLGASAVGIVHAVAGGGDLAVIIVEQVDDEAVPAKPPSQGCDVAEAGMDLEHELIYLVEPAEILLSRQQAELPAFDIRLQQANPIDHIRGH